MRELSASHIFRDLQFGLNICSRLKRGIKVLITLYIFRVCPQRKVKAIYWFGDLIKNSQKPSFWLKINIMPFWFNKHQLENEMLQIFVADEDNV